VIPADSTHGGGVANGSRTTRPEDRHPRHGRRRAGGAGAAAGALYGAGAKTDLLSIHPGEIQARQWDINAAGTFAVDRLVSDAKPDDYDALLLPGGTMNPDQLRMNRDAVAFVKAFVASGKPIAAICHGPWTLIEADAVRGRRLTSWPSIRTDLRNAGAEVVDEEVVIDGQFTTSRSPADLPAFCRAILEQFAKSEHRVPG
jgi:protease I